MEDEMTVYTIYDTLNQIENEYIAHSFLRIHQSYLVNLKHIKWVERYEALLSDGTKLSIPKARYRFVKEAFTAYMDGRHPVQAFCTSQRDR